MSKIHNAKPGQLDFTVTKELNDFKIIVDLGRN